MTFRHHSQKGVKGLGDLILRTRDRNNITGLFRARKVDFTIPLLLEVFDISQTSNKLSMVESVYDDCLGDKFGILEVNHLIST